VGKFDTLQFFLQVKLPEIVGQLPDLESQACDLYRVLHKIARMFWSRILDYCLEFHKIERKDAEQLLFAANERRDLRTYLIDAGSVTLPNVFLDYNLPKISRYATSYNKVKDTLNVIEYLRENYTEWKEATYHHLTNVMMKKILIINLVIS